MRSQDDAGKADLAISIVTNMIGALTMSRIVDDPALSDQILEATRKRLVEAFDLVGPKGRGESAKRAPKLKKARAKSRLVPGTSSLG
jgi:TetR/AcrR family transcriptional repressor of nem operon